MDKFCGMQGKEVEWCRKLPGLRWEIGISVGLMKNGLNRASPPCVGDENGIK